MEGWNDMILKADLFLPDGRELFIHAIAPMNGQCWFYQLKGWSLQGLQTFFEAERCGFTTENSPEFIVRNEEIFHLDTNASGERYQPTGIKAGNKVKPREAFTEQVGCGFQIKLPSHFKMEPLFAEGNSLDICDYSFGSSNNEDITGSISCSNKSRFDYSDIKELYAAGVKNTDFNVTHKTQKRNWFVLSGINRKNGNIVYWKRVEGDNYISDMRIEYPKAIADKITPRLNRIVDSFRSD